MRRGNRQAVERAEWEPLLMVVRPPWSRAGENRERDAMMGKREIKLEERLAPRRRGQAGQNPHATPAFPGLLEQHAVAPPHKGVRLRQADGNRSLFLDRQHRRVWCAAE